jgi:peptidoglycan/LPS O-acetylase OafA/YrhL
MWVCSDALWDGFQVKAVYHLQRWMKTQTVRELLDQYNGVAPGFDALRLVLCFIVVVCHSVTVTYPVQDSEKLMLHPGVIEVMRCVLPMFFFLSGFLVTGSAFRMKKTAAFLACRVSRILPALLTEVLLSAFVLGAMTTTLPLGAYYKSPEFLPYMLNVVGSLHYWLPGVFTGHPVSIVNINLWTLPYELRCYLIMTALVATGIIFQRRLYLGIFMIASFYLLALFPASHWWHSDYNHVRPVLLVYSFFLGALCRVFDDRVPMSRELAACSLLLVPLIKYDYTQIVGLFAICYLALWIGLRDLRKFPLARRGDYSYGIYLYGFPIQQALWHYLPVLRGAWPLTLVALPVTILVAMGSRRFIERPFLDLKKKLVPDRERLAAPAA